MKALHVVDGPPPANEDPASLGDVLEFMRLLWVVDHRMSAASEQMRSALGVTGRQRLVLRMVGRFPGITASRLASLLHLHPSTLTGVVKRLVKHGYLERQEDAADARRAFLRLTPAGQALDVPATGTVEAAVERLLLRMPEEHRLAAREVLTALAEELLVPPPRRIGAPGKAGADSSCP